MPDPKPIRGPVYVGATPLLVTLDVAPLVSANVHDLLDLLRGEFLDDFVELDTAGRFAFEALQARLVARLATKVALTGRQAVKVAAQVDQLGRERTIPGQQDRRAS